MAGARKANGTAKVREIIADASAKVRDIPREDGAAPDPERVAKVWAAAVRKLWDMSGKPKQQQTPPPPPPADPPADPNTDGADTDTETETTSTMQQRVLRLAAERGAVRLALSGGHVISRDALVALGRESRDLAHDIAAMLDATQDMAATG